MRYNLTQRTKEQLSSKDLWRTDGEVRKHDFRDANTMLHLTIPINICQTIAVRRIPANSSDRKPQARGNEQRRLEILVIHLLVKPTDTCR